ncbi:MAG: alanine racemase [Firmicutes bacterium HGW-Firmicutes-19]|jgi:alanine racemase|nr:MAG: alanine racemase [Firmicutes bacterium HGW-Firmicutes-19]
MTTFRNTWVDIDLDRLTSNIKILKKTSGKSIFGVIKANAYGHGDIEIARQLERLEVSYLCVSSLDEAVHLRNHDIKAPIMVLGYTETEHLSIAINREITCIIPSKEWLEEALAQNNMLDRLKLHIKIDSGMNRVGLKTISELKEVIHIARGHNLNIEGLYTHLSSSNIEDGAITKKQIEKFSQFKNSAEISFKWVHTSNSDAALSLGELDNISNAIRCGIAMYGYSTFEKGLDPILSMYCGINQVKKLAPGDQVSYSATYTAVSHETIAVLPIGYADGLDRKLQGYEFIVNGVACEVVGRVCMDLTMIRVPDYTTSKDIVEIIGKFGDAAKMAKYLQTISYEILTSISPRITRHYLLDGKVVKISNERFD